MAEVFFLKEINYLPRIIDIRGITESEAVIPGFNVLFHIRKAIFVKSIKDFLLCISRFL